jgi:hypothetical protein
MTANIFPLEAEVLRRESVERKQEWPRRSVHSVEPINNRPHFDYGSVKYREQGFTLANPCFINRYVNEELYILVRFRIRQIDEDFIACFHCERSPSSFGPDILRRVSPGPSLHYVQGRVGSVNMLSDAPVVDECTDSEQKAVLVDVVKAMEPPERVIPSLVWFDRADNVYRVFPHSIYFSSEHFLFMWGGKRLVEDWESGLICDRAAIHGNETAGQIVKGTPQILENISSNQAQLDRDDQILSQAIDSLSRVRVSLYDEAVGARIYEAEQRDLEIMEVFVGPFDF